MSLLLLFNQPSSGPVITVQPTDQSASVGGTANFSFGATGYSTAQWQTAAPIAFAQAAITGTPANLTLSTAASPGAQSITVPSDAEGVLFFWSAYAFDLSSLTSNFTDTFTLVATGNNGLADGVGVAYARVTSTGSKTVTPVWGGAQTNGPVFWTVFVKNIPTSGTWVRGYDTQHSPDNPPSSALVGTVSSTTTDVVIAYDEQYLSTVPAAETGWTSLGTLTFNNYNSRLSKADSPGASTTSFSGNGTAFPVLSLVSIISRPAGFGAWTNVSTGSGGTTSSWTTGTLSLSDNGYKVRALLDGSLATNEVTLTVTSTATHATSGALTGQGSSIAGTAAHIAVHGTSGALTGQGSTIAGASARFRAFSTSGALTGQGSTIVGSAAKGTGATTHDTSGALTGSGSAIAGTSARLRAFSSSGVLTGQGSALAGTAVHNTVRPTSGALIGQGSVIVGTAARTGVAVTHSTSGALVGSGSLINGSAFIGQILQDTHDGYWHKQWEKLHKKKPKLEEVIELVKEEPEIALEEVKEAVKREYPQIDYSQVARNAELQAVVAKQLLIALELRRIADDEDDIEILLLL